MKTALAFLLLATAAQAREFHLERIRGGSVDETPENPFNPHERLITVTETFHLNTHPGDPGSFDLLRWDYIADDGVTLASVEPYTVNFPFKDFGNVYNTLELHPSPQGTQVQWTWRENPRTFDSFSYRPRPDRSERITPLIDGERYQRVVGSPLYGDVPEPATHIMLSLVGVLAWCLARKWRA